MVRGLIDRIPLGRRLASGAGWALVMRTATIAMGVLVTSLLARLLAPEDLATYFLIFSIVSFLVVLSQLGMNQAVVRLVAGALALGDVSEAKRTIASVFRYGVLGSLTVAGIYYAGVGEFLSKQVFPASAIGALIGLTAVWIVLSTLQRLLAETFRGFHDIRLATTFGGFVTYALSACVLGWIFVAFGEASISETLSITVMASGVSVLIALGILVVKLGRLERYAVQPTPKGKPDSDNSALRRMVWPLVVGNLVNVLMQRSDIWIVGASLPAEELAVYSAAQRLIMLVVIPVMMIGAVVPPMIAELNVQRDHVRLEQMLRSAATMSALPSGTILLLLIVFGPWILSLVYGDFYADGAVVLAILSIGQMFSVLAGACAQVLLMTGNERVLLVINAIALTVAVAVSFLTVNSYGVYGVAGAYALGVILQNAGMVYYSIKRVGVRTYVGKLPARREPGRRRDGARRRHGARRPTDAD